MLFRMLSFAINSESLAIPLPIAVGAAAKTDVIDTNEAKTRHKTDVLRMLDFMKFSFFYKFKNQRYKTELMRVFRLYGVYS